MAKNQAEVTARAAGYTREVLADCGQHTLSLLVMPGQDYDDTFKAWDLDEDEYVIVNGWLWTFEEA